jgi:hypothetical protein
MLTEVSIFSVTNLVEAQGHFSCVSLSKTKFSRIDSVVIKSKLKQSPRPLLVPSKIAS